MQGLIGCELARLYRHALARQHPLEYLQWECTRRCDLSCLHCGSDCRKDSSVPDMPLERFREALREVAAFADPRTVMLGITGGEPLLRADLEDCGSAAAELGFRWGLVTNGMGLSASRLDSLLSAGLSSLSISLDGLEASHNALRRHPEAFDRASRAIREAAARSGLVFDVISCIHPGNFGELEAVEDLLVSLGVRAWRVFAIFPKGRAGANRALSLGSEGLARLLRAIASIRERGRIDASYSCEGWLGPYEGRARDAPFSCRAGVSSMAILCDGSVTGCVSMGPEWAVGRLGERGLAPLWEHGFDSMRRRAWLKTGPCARCASWRACEGGSLHLRAGDGGLGACPYKGLASS
jgi:radical SAM enzyme (rSAM/lipoprotein system)